MKILFLLPPSEGKNSENKYLEEELSFNFEKPLEIASSVTEKDLKCSWERYKEGLELNKNIEKSETIEAINRYTWVMYNAIDYSWMTEAWKKFFENNFLVFSWMYGIVRPLDKIANYKLPVWKVELYKFWWDIVPDTIIKEKPDYIVNLLSGDYAKMIGLGTKCNRHKKKLEKILDAWMKVININFLKEDWKKISHWVKKIKGEWIKDICENNLTNYEQFWWELVKNWNIIDVNIIK